MDLSGFSLKARNFKCFSDPQGFDTILPLNIIVGRNNTGKSSLIDLVEYAIRRKSIDRLGHRNRTPEAELSWKLEQGFIDNHLRGLGGQVHDHGDFASRYLMTSPLRMSIGANQQLSFTGWADPPQGIGDPSALREIGTSVVNKLNDPLTAYAFRRIAADRDIKPEKDDNPLGGFAESSIDYSGVGATTVIQRLLHNDNLPADLIEGTVLAELNQIYKPDAQFTRIDLKRRSSDGHWELYLAEEEKGLIPLSQTGSGLKTILLVLLNLYFFPKLVYKRPLPEFVFGFEELENNLHPALQRRLFLYLSSKAKDEGCHFFITTHSSVVIDLFSRDELAQVLHVTHDRTCAKVMRVSTYQHRGGALRDLDVRASDLLQANAIVWVEGPSDRLYFNRWVELWDGELKEGVHYQCMFSGGTLIEGFSFDDPEEAPESIADHESQTEQVVEEFIEALRINRHAVVLMDRDRGKDETLKLWVSRIESELRAMDGVPWVTGGREVENYIPVEVLRSIVSDKRYTMKEVPGRYDRFFECVQGPRGGDLSGSKTKLARWACELMTIEQIETTLDLAARLEAVCNKLRSWNAMPECPRRAT